MRSQEQSLAYICVCVCVKSALELHPFIVLWFKNCSWYRCWYLLIMYCTVKPFGLIISGRDHTGPSWPHPSVLSPLCWSYVQWRIESRNNNTFCSDYHHTLWLLGPYRGHCQLRLPFIVRCSSAVYTLNSHPDTPTGDGKDVFNGCKHSASLCEFLIAVG